MATDNFRSAIDEVTKKLVDGGKIIEAGWTAMRLSVLPPNASEVQITEMRKAFFAGAQHLFASIMSMLDAGSEPTEKDLQRMTSISEELNSFVKEFKEATFS